MKLGGRSAEAGEADNLADAATNRERKIAAIALAGQLRKPQPRRDAALKIIKSIPCVMQASHPNCNSEFGANEKNDQLERIRDAGKNRFY